MRILLFFSLVTFTAFAGHHEKIELAPEPAKETAAKEKKHNSKANFEILSSLKAATISKLNEEGTLVDTTLSADIDYYVFYFSSNFAPSCRKFSPKLQEFYENSFGKTLKKYDIILVSGDRNERVMVNQMKKASLTFKTLPYQSELAQKVTLNFGTTIYPTLVIVDPQGKVFSTSDMKNKNVYHVLKDLEKLVQK